jgi:hypothetical protein
MGAILEMQAQQQQQQQGETRSKHETLKSHNCPVQGPYPAAA